MEYFIIQTIENSVIETAQVPKSNFREHKKIKINT